MKKQEFHFTDVIGVMTWIIFRPQGIEGVGSVLSFMTGENLSRENYGPARVDCLPELIKQFPNLNPDTKEMKAVLLEFKQSLPENIVDRDGFIKEWLDKFKNGEFGIKCSELLEVAQLPTFPKDVGIVYISGFRGIGD